jgi:hypothetical protein
MKLRKKLAAMFLAAAMVVTFAACSSDDDNGSEGSGSNEPAPSGSGSQPGDNDTPGTGLSQDDRPNVAVAEGFDFGAFKFSSMDFVIEFESILTIGGNPQQGFGASAIRIAGFVGDAPDAFLANPELNLFHDEPEDRLWGMLISNNGPFWRNVSRIEAFFYLEGDQDSDDIVNVESNMIGGGLMGYNFVQSGVNELAQWDEDLGGPGFAFGSDHVFHLVWDIDNFRDNHGSAINPAANPDGEYVFDDEPRDVNGSLRGGGINSFGFQVRYDDINNDMNARINWTDAVVYVHCMDTWNQHLAELSEITEGHFTPSANTEGRVRLA